MQNNSNKKDSAMNNSSRMYVCLEIIKGKTETFKY